MSEKSTGILYFLSSSNLVLSFCFFVRALAKKQALLLAKRQPLALGQANVPVCALAFSHVAQRFACIRSSGLKSSSLSVWHCLLLKALSFNLALNPLFLIHVVV